MEYCEVRGCQSIATSTVEHRLSHWRVAEKRKVCRAHAAGQGEEAVAALALLVLPARRRLARRELSTKVAALREMVAPGLVAVATPVIVGLLLGYEAVAHGNGRWNGGIARRVSWINQ